MQVSGATGTNYQSYGNMVRDRASSSTSFTEKPDDAVAEGQSRLEPNPILQNLLENESVQKLVSVGEDGTYAFNWNVGDGALNAQQQVARYLIGAANAAGTANRSSATYAQSDLDLFRQSTGYNLVVTAEGGELIVDDNGNPPAAADMDKVNAAWQFINSIGFARADGAISGDVTLENFPQILDRFGTATLSENLVRNMLKDFMSALGASAEDMSGLRSSAQSGHDGEQIYTWSWTRTQDTASRQASDLAERLKYLSA